MSQNREGCVRQVLIGAIASLLSGILLLGITLLVNHFIAVNTRLQDENVVFEMATPLTEVEIFPVVTETPSPTSTRRSIMRTPPTPTVSTQMLSCPEWQGKLKLYLGTTYFDQTHDSGYWFYFLDKYVVQFGRTTYERGTELIKKLDTSKMSQGIWTDVQQFKDIKGGAFWFCSDYLGVYAVVT